MKEIKAQIIFRCSCNFESKVQDTDRVVMPLTHPNNPTAKYELIAERIPDSFIFLEQQDENKPEWAQNVHYIIPLDVTKINIPHFAKFQSLLDTIRTPAGIPQCRLRDVLTGTGLFYGMWEEEEPTLILGAPPYLRLIEGGKSATSA